MQGKRQRWTEEQQEQIKQRYENEGPSLLAVEQNRSSASIKLKAHRMGLRSRGKQQRWTAEEEEKVKRRYVLEGPEFLALELGRSLGSICAEAQRQGIKSQTRYARSSASLSEKLRDRSVNSHFFDEWNPNSAYTLGFLHADGNVFVPTRKSHDWALQFTNCELDTLRQIKRVMDSRHRICPNKNELRKGLESSKPCFHLKINGRRLVEKVISLGFEPRKSTTNPSFPQIPDFVLNHYSRGHLDGDGCVSSAIKFDGSKRYIEGMQNALIRVLGVPRNKVMEHGYSDLVWRIQWTAKRDLRIFYDWLYPEGDYPFMQRKKDALFALVQ